MDKIKLVIEGFFLKLTNKQKGQVIVEYVLLLVVSTVIALLLIQFVSLDSGPFFEYWKKLLEVVGEDIST